MATQIIDDVNSTLVNLIMAEFASNPPFDVSFAQPDTDFNPISNTRPTVNLYLYDIKENLELRSNEPITEKRADGTVRERRPPVRIKLSYLITAWSPAAHDNQGTRTREEHIALSNILMALVKYRKIPDNFLVGDLIGQQPPMPTAVVLPDGLKNPGEFWGTFEGRPVRPAIEYCITFSLDYHETIEGKMVFAKVSDYGSMTSIFRLTIRPPIRAESPPDHPKDTPIAKLNIEATPVISVRDNNVHQGDLIIHINDSSELSVGDVLILVDGKKSEFCEVADFASGEEAIFVSKPMLFDHDSGTELKKLSSETMIGVKIAAVASANCTSLKVSGPEIKKLKIGDIIKINNPDKIEYSQITEIAGPEMGLSTSSDSFVQVGGIVTNLVGAPVTGAEVSLFNANSVLMNQTISDAEGRFSFGNLSKGKYVFKIIAQGYKQMDKTINDIASAQFDDFIFKLESV